VLLFAWGFAMHAAGLLLHEFAGHAVAASVFGCGISGWNLTYFGHGEVHYARCGAWTLGGSLVADWAGIAVATAAGGSALLVLRRRGASAGARLLAATFAFFFLVNQLGYATSGGFHDLYDPADTSILLAKRGLHWLAWLAPLAAYTAAAFGVAPAMVDAAADVLGSRSRRARLADFLATLGVAGALYFAAFRVERALRSDMTARGVALEAERVAREQHAARPFPIDLVLLVVAAGALVYALGRPLRASPGEGGTAPRPIVEARLLAVVVGAAAAAFAVLFALIAAAR
jgi:hypothetical protein